MRFGAFMVARLGAVLALGACHPPEHDDEVVASARLPPSGLPLPFVEQETDYSCGPAALLSVLRYWRVFDGREQDLYAPLGTTAADGTEPYRMAALASARFQLASAYETDVTLDQLRAAFARGETVILDLQAWPDEPVDWATDWEDGHYVVLAGLDDERSELVVMDPSIADSYVAIPVSEFLDRWHDYEMRDGKVRQLEHMAIFFSGACAMRSVPRENEQKL